MNELIQYAAMLLVKEKIDRLKYEIGDLQALTSTSKTNLVSAVNELASRASDNASGPPNPVQLSSLSERVDSVEVEISGLQQAFNEALVSIASSQDAISALAETSSAGPVQLSSLAERVGSVEGEVLGLQQAFNEALISITSSQDAISTLTETLSASGKLLSNLSLYVSTVGNDANDGLQQSSAFRTIQRAIEVAASLDSSIFDVTINIGPGTYQKVKLKTLTGTGRLTLLSLDPLSRAVISATAPDWCVTAEREGNFRLKDVDLVGGTFLVYCDGAFVNLDGCGLRDCPSYGIYALNHGRVSVTGATKVSGHQGVLFLASDFGLIDIYNVFSFTGSSVGVLAEVRSAGKVKFASFSWTGTLTGSRFRVMAAGVLETGQAATWLPGSSAGIVDVGGHHV